MCVSALCLLVRREEGVCSEKISDTIASLFAGHVVLMAMV